MGNDFYVFSFEKSLKMQMIQTVKKHTKYFY